MKKLDKQKFKGDKGKTHTEKVRDHFEKTSDEVEEVYKYLHKNYDPVMHYKNGAVVKYLGNNGFGYTGGNIEYEDGYARVKFVDSFGDSIISVAGEEMLGECAGHIKVEIWRDEFILEIETASGTILEMTDMDIRMLKKLNSFLNYALNDKAVTQVEDK